MQLDGIMSKYKYTAHKETKKCNKEELFNPFSARKTKKKHLKNGKK